MSKLTEQTTQPAVRLRTWFSLYSFDVIGDVGFSHSFSMMEAGKENDAIKQLHDSMSLLSIFNHISWALNLIPRMKVGAKLLIDHMEWATRSLAERMRVRL